ncbi:MAG: peptidoglycan editing factor PgeF [Actinobacteria bacterium]|nr:peptidoglycan editing factor PgeF [Actinomycetota bacterium]
MTGPAEEALRPDTRSLFTSRESGNLSFAGTDQAATVVENRHKVSERLGISSGWVTVHQVHASGVLVATREHAGFDSSLPKADAIVTSEPDLPIAIFTADCVPVCLTSRDAVGVIHAGWRGLAGSVIPRTVESLRSLSEGRITAQIGPCIGPCHYEVGEDVLDSFRATHPSAPDPSVVIEGSLRFDLRAAARWQLEDAGVEVSSSKVPCTFCDHRYFSHRREEATGRQALILWR